VPIQSGFVIGLLDGLLGTIFMLYEAADGALKKTQSYFSAASSYLSGLVDHYRKNQTYWSVFAKIGQDTKEAIKAQWDKVVTTFTALQAVVSALELRRIRSLLSSMAAEARIWLGVFLEGDADPAYDVGTIAFEVILAAFTGGAANGIAASANVGSGFLPRIFKFLDGLEYPESGRFGGLMSTAFTKAQKVTNGRPENPVAYRKNLLCRLGVGGCFIAGTPVLLAGGLAPIDSVQLLQYAVCHQTINQPAGPEAYDPYTSAQQRERDHYEVDSLNWFEVVFQPLNSSSYCKLALHQDWMRRQGIDSVGHYQYLSLPEQGITGLSQVTSIRHILPQKQPEDDKLTDDYGFQPVTGIFVHGSDNVWMLTFENGDTLGVTYNHPLWSVDAGGWRLAGELEVGEVVLTLERFAIITTKQHLPRQQPVWNLEVREWHNFLVGESGVVAHNNYGVLTAVLNAAKNIGVTYNADLSNGSNFFKCVEKAKALRRHLRSSGIQKPKSKRIQILDVNGEPARSGFIGWDILDVNGEIVKTHQIATTGFHEYTVINGKVFDNISPNGIELNKFLNRIVPQFGSKVKTIDIED
jgi:hypothetical protein